MIKKIKEKDLKEYKGFICAGKWWRSYEFKCTCSVKSIFDSVVLCIHQHNHRLLTKIEILQDIQHIIEQTTFWREE